jgi:hypothetical protein
MSSIETGGRTCDLSRMAKGPQMLTANRLRDGAVVYWQAGTWREALAGAEVFEEAEPAKAALEAAAAHVRAREVVNPYLFDVRVEAGAAVPVKEREIIRAAGPSVRADLGKQAQQRSGITSQKRQTGAAAGEESNLEGEGI